MHALEQSENENANLRRLDEILFSHERYTLCWVIGNQCIIQI